MAHLLPHPLNLAPMPTSSSDSQFVPRPEFRPDDRITSSFSVLTLSGSAFIRAYGFPPPVAAAFRRHLELRQLILQYREDTAEDLYEFALLGKPWNNPRRVQSERLLIDLLSIILQNGYHFLSTIDYGREQDDRVIMTFSRPNIPPSHSPKASTSVIQGVGNESVTTCSPHVTQTLFALSFPNSNTLRVISPPLHSTPAILKTVRGSCPRRVVSEKAAGNNVYEFKLKGYKWFKQDTFATDSLRHVISLLSSLDSYGFTLLTSLSLENPSRVKDLWIFTGPAHTPSSESAISSPNHSTAEVRRAAVSDPKASNAGGFALTTQGDVFARGPGHARSASDTAAIRQHPPVIPQHHGVLRKPAPRAKLPESIRLSNSSHENLPLPPADGHTIMHRTSEELIRATMASTVGSAVDMTGIGTHKFQPIPSPAEGYPATHQAVPPQTSPTVFYTASPSGHNPYFPSFPSKHPEDPTTPHSAATGPTAPHHTHTKHNMTHLASSSVDMAPRHAGPANRPPPTPLSSDDPGHSHTGSSSSHSPHSQSHMPGNLTPPLLSPGAFRDSAFSSNTGQTCEIPIKWTGPDHEKNGAVSREPHLPGGWVSPVVEDPREEVQQATGGGTYRSASESPRRRDFARPGSHERENGPERHEVKVAAPKVVHPMVGRNSEAAVVGDFSHRLDKGKQKEPPVPVHHPSHEHETHRPAHIARPVHEHEPHRPAHTAQPAHVTDNQGWVLVNIGTGSPSSQMPPSTPASSRPKNGSDPALARRPAAPRGPSSNSTPNLKSVTHSPSPHGTHPSSMSPAAKAIVVVDAIEARRDVEKKKVDRHSLPPSGLRRMLSLSRGNSTSKNKATKQPPGAPVQVRSIKKSRSFEHEAKVVEKKVGFRERLRRLGATEASKSSRRVSVD